MSPGVIYYKISFSERAQRNVHDNDYAICGDNLLKTKRNLLYISYQSVPRCKHFPPRL